MDGLFFGAVVSTVSQKNCPEYISFSCVSPELSTLVNAHPIVPTPI